MDSTQLSLIIGGPNRPPSKRQLAQAQADELARRSTARSNTTTAASSSSGREPEGWGAYLSRNVQERTERLGMMGEGVDRLEENSAGWAEDVNKFVARQKRGLMMGGEL